MIKEMYPECTYSQSDIALKQLRGIKVLDPSHVHSTHSRCVLKWSTSALIQSFQPPLLSIRGTTPPLSTHIYLPLTIVRGFAAQWEKLLLLIPSAGSHLQHLSKCVRDCAVARLLSVWETVPYLKPIPLKRGLTCSGRGYCLSFGCMDVLHNSWFFIR